MSKIYPNEDFAGIVIIGSLVSALIFGFIGYLIQGWFRKKTKRNLQHNRTFMIH